MSGINSGSTFADAMVETVELPLLALDSDLRVEIANDAFLSQFEVQRSETVGRSIYDLGNGQWDIPELRRLLDDILPRDEVVKDYRVDHEFENIGRRIMRLNARRIHRSDADDSILIAIHDDTERERLQKELEGRIEFADKLIDSVREGLLVLDSGLRVHSANEVFYELFHVDRDRTVGSLVYDLGNGQWNIPELRRLLQEILPKERSFDDYQVRHTFESIGERVMLLNGRRLDHLDLILLAFRDITGQQEAEQARIEHERRQTLLLKLADALRPLRNPSDVESEACRILGEQLHVDRACYVEISEATGDARVEKDFVRADAPSLAGEHRIEDFAWSVDILRDGGCHVISDIRTSDLVPPDDRPACLALDIVACMCVPLLRGERLVGALCVGNRRPREWADSDLEILRIVSERIWSAIDRARAETAVIESERLLRQAMAAADAGSWKLYPDTGEFFASDRAMELHGRRPGTPMTHEEALACVEPEDRPMIEAKLTAALGSGEAFKVEYRAPQQNGTHRWLASSAERRIEGGRPVCVGLVQNITERKQNEERIRLLMREVNHRSKNMLGLVHAIAHQTARRHSEDFLEHFDDRIQALAAAQDLLVASEWKPVSLSDLLVSQFNHFADLIGDRIAIEGPPLLVSPESAQSIGMAVHELATNAAKYGALSNDTGRIDLGWHIDVQEPNTRRFLISWKESGGPPVKTPEKKGFGTSVTTAMIESNLSADVDVDFAPGGFCWSFSTDAEHILESGGTPPRSSESKLEKAVDKQMGRRILVVEDEALLAEDIAATLSEAGLQVIGPAANVDHALRLIEQYGCEAAVLDFNLRDATSEPVADKLTAMKAPFVAVTGYNRSQLPTVFQKAPIVSKPIKEASLLAELDRLLG